MEEYAVNQFSDIRQRLDQLVADRAKAQRLLELRMLGDADEAPLKWRREFARLEIILSEFWYQSDEAATEEWFDPGNDDTDNLYLLHMKAIGAHQRHRLAMRRYAKPGKWSDVAIRYENTATLLARLIELNIIEML